VLLGFYAIGLKWSQIGVFILLVIIGALQVAIILQLIEGQRLLILMSGLLGMALVGGILT
jgi:hypothetical protein